MDSLATTDEAAQTDTASREAVYDGFISYSHAADDLLAPRLQAGLQRFAKPWWKRRALRVFRDESSLSANPHLWSSITSALDDADWFVLLLSEDAAQSEWVNREVEYWVAHKDSSRVLPVVTDGEFGWADGDISQSSTAAPPALSGVFEEEPRWVDLRWVRTDEHLDLSNSRFSDAVADIASAIRGVPKDELASEEVRQHRRTIRTAWAAGAVVLLLGIAATVGAIVAVGQSREAQTQRDEAEHQAQVAQEKEQEATRNAEVARSREFAASAISVFDQDPELSVLLALTAVGYDRSPQTLSVLHTALQRHRLTLSVAWAPERLTFGFFMGAALSPAGDLLAVAGSANEVEVWDVSDRDGPLWTTTVNVADVQLRWPRFTKDGSMVLIGAGQRVPEIERDPEAGYGIYGFDARTGGQVAFWPTDQCWGFQGLLGNGFIDTSAPALVQDVCEDGVFRLGLIDFETSDITPLASSPNTFGYGSFSLSPDGRYLAMGWHDPIAVLDLETGEEYAHELPGPHATFSPDGAFLLVGGDPLQLWDMETQRVVREYPGQYFAAGFSADLSLVYGARFDGPTEVFDRASGKLLFHLLGPGGVWTETTADKTSIVNAGLGVGVYDIGSVVQGEIGIIWLGDEPTYHLAAALDSAKDLAVTWSLNLLDNTRRVSVYEPDTESVRFSVAGEGAALSPDASLLAIQPTIGAATFTEEQAGPGYPAGGYHRIGAVQILDATSGEVVSTLEGLCDWFAADTPEFLGKDYGPGLQIPGPECGENNPPLAADDLEFSPDGTLVALSSRRTGTVGIWETGSGLLRWREPMLQHMFTDAPTTVAFSPDGSILATSEGTEVVIIDVATAEAITRIPHTGNQPFYEMEFTPDGQLLLGSDQTNLVMLIDTATWTELEPLVVTEGEGVRDIDLTSDGTVLATAGDRLLRVWSLADRAMRVEVEMAEQIRGVEFLDDTHLLVLPKTQNAAVIITLDPAELTEVAVNRLTRSYTDQECATYTIDPCPTLEDIRAGSA